MKKLILFIVLLIPFVLKAQVSPVTPQWKGGNAVNYLPYTWPGKTHPDTIGNLKLIRQMIGTKTNDSIIFDIHHFTYVDSILRVANDTIGTGDFFVFDKTTGFGRRDTSTHLTNWLHADFRLHNNGFKFQPDSILIKQSIFTAGLFGREFDFSDSTETAQYKFNGFKFYKKSDSTQNYVRVRFLSDSTYWQGKPITWNNVNNFKNLVYFRDVPTGSGTDSVLVSHGGVVEKIGPISVTASNGLNTDNGDVELGGALTGFTDIDITGNTLRLHATNFGINNTTFGDSSFQSYHTDNLGNASDLIQNAGGGQNRVAMAIHQNIFDIGDRTIVFQIDSVMGAHLTDYTLKGIKYNFTGHYSLLTDSSLVPKRYVDSLVASGGGGTTTNALTLSYGLTGQPLTFNGSVARTATVDSTVMVNKTFAGRYVQTNTNASVKSNSISGTGGLGFDDLISQSASPTSVTNHIRLYSDSLNRLSWKNSTYRRTLQIPYPSDYTARFPYRVTGTTLEDSTHAATTYATIGSVVTYTASNGVVKTGTNFTSDTTYNRTVANSPTLAQLQTKFNLYPLKTTTLTAGTGISTIGDLSVNRTITADTSILQTVLNFFPKGDTRYAKITALPTGANPTASAGTTAVNGSASTFMRSDAAPKVDSTIFATTAKLSTYLTKAQIVAGYLPINNPSATGQMTVTGTTTPQLSADYDATHLFTVGVSSTGGTTLTSTSTLSLAPVNNSIVLGSTSAVLSGNAFQNITSANNAKLSLLTTGATLVRNVADANPLAIFNQSNSSSTGDISDFQFNGTTKVAITQPGYITQSIGGIGTTALVTANFTGTDVAAVGAQKYSPIFGAQGSGWATTPVAAQTVFMGFQVQPTQGAAQPVGNLLLMQSVNGATPTATGIQFGLTGALLAGSVNATGNFLPTVTNNSTVGTSALTLQKGWFNALSSSSSSALTLSTPGAASMIFQTNGATNATLFSTGNLLVQSGGTQSDSTAYKFSVIGRARISQFVAASTNDSLMAFNPTTHGLRMTKLVAGNGISTTYASGNITIAEVLRYQHTIFTPTTGGTVTLVNNQYNIINPAGALLALTVTLPSSPANNDVVYIKFTQNVTTVTYAGGTVVDGITAPTAGGLTVLTYDGGTTSWY